MTQLQFRGACRDDFDELLVLFGQLWPSKQFDLDQFRAVYLRVISNPAKRYVCAILGGRIVGLGSVTFKDNLWQEGEIAYVEEVVIHEKAREKGIGTQLMKHLEQLARERGCRRIELDTAFYRAEAHRLYERLGFEKRAFLYTKILPP